MLPCISVSKCSKNVIYISTHVRFDRKDKEVSTSAALREREKGEEKERSEVL